MSAAAGSSSAAQQSHAPAASAAATSSAVVTFSAIEAAFNGAPWSIEEDGILMQKRSLFALFPSIADDFDLLDADARQRQEKRMARELRWLHECRSLGEINQRLLYLSSIATEPRQVLARALRSQLNTWTCDLEAAESRLASMQAKNDSAAELSHAREVARLTRQCAHLSRQRVYEAAQITNAERALKELRANFEEQLQSAVEARQQVMDAFTEEWMGETAQRMVEANAHIQHHSERAAAAELELNRAQIRTLKAEYQRADVAQALSVARQEAGKANAAAANAESLKREADNQFASLQRQAESDAAEAARANALLAEELADTQLPLHEALAEIVQLRQSGEAAAASHPMPMEGIINVKEEKTDVENEKTAAQEQAKKAGEEAQQAVSHKRKAEADVEEQKEHHERRIEEHRSQQARLGAQSANEPLKPTCSSCRNAPPACLYQPCGHTTLCAACDAALPHRVCPMCQTEIQTKHNVYFQVRSV
jgi:hypothetical protein